MTVIDNFAGKYRFLSNFYPAEVFLDGVCYPSVEHAFQAAKTTDASARRRVRRAQSPAEAKRLGRLVQLRPGWDTMRVEVMTDLVRQKFKHPQLRRQLLETGDAHLIEGNTWGDRFWGKVRGRGENWLGCILMRVRGELADAHRHRTPS